jgi:biotin carboxyl carrier protein
MEFPRSDHRTNEAIMEENSELQNFSYDGVEVKTLFTRKFANRKPYEAPDPRKVSAFIPGTIIEVFVKEKAKVKKGDQLVSLQAMKMNNNLIAPIDGVVKKVHVKKGDVVVKNQLLVELK